MIHFSRQLLPDVELLSEDYAGEGETRVPIEAGKSQRVDDVDFCHTCVSKKLCIMRCFNLAPEK